MLSDNASIVPFENLQYYLNKKEKLAKRGELIIIVIINTFRKGVENVSNASFGKRFKNYNHLYDPTNFPVLL